MMASDEASFPVDVTSFVILTILKVVNRLVFLFFFSPHRN